MAEGLNSCVFVVRHDTPLELIAARVTRLAEFYAPLGVAGATLRRLPNLRLAVGDLTFAAPASEASSVAGQLRWEPAERVEAFWGGPVPAGLRGDLGTATDQELRALDRNVVMFAATEKNARLVNGCAGATGLYVADGDGVSAWSTHAVAAAYLARGTAAIDPSAVPRIFAAEFVGGSRTQIRNVRPLARATVVDFRPDAYVARSYWPASERFAAVPSSEALEHAEKALIESLGRRLAKTGSVQLGLTAGVDSRVAATALREAGVAFQAMTVAPALDAPDAAGARSVAEALGLEHTLHPYRLQPDSDSVSSISAEARWSEGVAPLNGLGTAEGATPEVVVTGSGGEVGRCWYYRWLARNYRTPSLGQLRQVLCHLHWRIDGASPEAHRALDGATTEWLVAAQETGWRGWATLDVLYDEQRMAHWGRGRLVRSEGAVLYAFSTPEVVRALISLPLAERLSDGFHRHFLGRYAPGIAIGEPRAQRTGVPRAVRRALWRARARRGLDRSAAERWPLIELWSDRPMAQEFIADYVLRHDLLIEGMGAAWLERTRAGFRRGETHATQAAFLAAALVALDDALVGLRN